MSAMGVREHDNTHFETVSRFNYSPHRQHTHTHSGELTTQSAVHDSSHMTAFRSIFFLLTGFTTQKQMQLTNLRTYFTICTAHNCPPYQYECTHMFCTTAPLQRAQSESGQQFFSGSFHLHIYTFIEPFLWPLIII